MKLTIVLLTTALLNVSAKGLSQTINFSGKNVSLEKIFSEIEKQTGYNITYFVDVLTGAKPISVDVKNVPLQEFLKIVLTRQGIEYKIDDRSIFLSRKTGSSSVHGDDPVLSGMKEIFSAAPIRGRVLDSLGQPLSGASVTIKNNKLSTLTNAEGVFTLNVNEGDVLLISYVGYEFRSVVITSSMLSSNNSLTVTLRPSVAKLDEIEVVSTGYQDIPKERATGSFVKIDNELLNRSVGINIMDRLNGVTSGVLGKPNTVPTIRGISTINADFLPLIVIDGFPYEQGEYLGLYNRINNININDIEDVTILKDAAAASIWGVRAGNGVIVITTKKGKLNKKAKIQFYNNIIVGEKPDLFNIPIISSADYLEFEKIYFSLGRYTGLINNTIMFPALSEGIEILNKRRLGLITSADSITQINALKEHDIRNDISRYFLQTSINQQYSMNISGGSEKIIYYGSVGYDRNRSNNVGDSYRRLTLRLDNTYISIHNLEVNAFINYTRSESDNNSLAIGNLIAKGVTKVAPYTKLTDANNNALSIPFQYRIPYVDTASYPSLLDWHYRPLDELKNINNTSNQIATRFGTGIKYIIETGFFAEIKYQYEKTLTTTNNYQNEKTFFTRNLINQYKYRDGVNDMYPIPSGGILDLSLYETSSSSFRTQLNFNKKGQQHEITALGGFEVRELNSAGNLQRKYGYNSDRNTYSGTINYERTYSIRPVGSGKIFNPDASFGTINRYKSYYANGLYSYRRRYSLSASARIDASNFFGVKTNQRKIPLWSVGLAWELSNENFYDISWLPLLKLRATYGFNGNTNNSATSFTILKYIDASNNPYINAPYAEIQSPPNTDLRWEKVKIVNLGLDFESNNARISGSVEYYYKDGLDLISLVLIDPTTGVLNAQRNASYTGNNARTRGRGIDVIINSNILTKKVNWHSNFIFSYATDKVVLYDQIPGVSGLLLTTTPFVGHPLFSVYSYKWGGLNPINGDPMGIVSDTVASYTTVLSGRNTTINDLDHKNAIPKLFGSLRNTFKYNRLSLSFNIIYKLDFYFRRNSINYSNLFNNWGGHSDYSIRWQKPGDEQRTNVPSMSLSVNANRERFYQFSQVLVEKGDHIRLQDIRLDFAILRNDLKKKKIAQDAMLYILANNIGILWRANKHKIDPDYGDGFGSLVPSRSIAIGLNIIF